MRKTIFLLVALVSAVIQSEAQNKKLLVAGTDVPVVAEKDINASELKEGQTIELVTADDVKVESGEVVIPKGSSVTARVRTSLKQRFLANQKKRLIIDIKEVKLPNGKSVALCNGVTSFTVSRSTGDLEAAPLKIAATNKYLIPTDYVIHAKVEVSLDISK
ncbi:MAG: hypothetical protein II404_14550 [Prevotella sp.]|nr:hypothetical protein [Prevotella sp.]